MNHFFFVYISGAPDRYYQGSDRRGKPIWTEDKKLAAVFEWSHAWNKCRDSRRRRFQAKVGRLER